MRFAKITAPAQGSIPWIIADDSLARGPGSKFLVAGWPGVEQIVWDKKYLDANWTENVGLGNRQISFSLLVEHEFASEDECFLFTMNLPKDCPSYGNLEMGIVGGAKKTYTGAVIRSIRPVSGPNDPQVVSMRLQYEIVAGAPN